MPGGVGGVASRGAPLSRLTAASTVQRSIRSGPEAALCLAGRVAVTHATPRRAQKSVVTVVQRVMPALDHLNTPAEKYGSPPAVTLATSASPATRKVRR